ncbi:MAG: gliding motility-associated C-terminal domain-containing protein [Bacteroidetes bacterium]|nr:gliding motility-associated C-terminal domain-containing protein [Bacteroidota bacterium]
MSASPTGGIFTGTGVTGDIFNPALAGPGSFPVGYSFTDGNGCTNTVFQNITVNALPVVNIDPVSPMCISAPPLTLVGMPAGGLFSGDGITGNIFDPSQAQAGDHLVTYTFTDINGCSSSITRTITVYQLPDVTLAAIAPVCIDVQSITLNGSPAGGIYSGTGVSGSIFYPPSAGQGNFTVTYTFSDANGCSNLATQQVTVNDLPVVSLAGLSNVCADASPVPLNGNPAGGNYSGTGVTGNQFFPSTAQAGTFLITYSFIDDNNCSNAASQSITVHALPSVTLQPVNDMCVDAQPVTLIGTPAGGTYNGTGVILNKFYPNVSGPGLVTLTYAYKDANGCKNAASTTFNVYNLPDVNWVDPPTDVCISTPPVTLSGGSPLGGVFSGTGVIGNIFYPSVAGIGTYFITYTFTDNHGCVNFAPAALTVNELPLLTYTGSFPDLCVNSASLLINTALPEGGTYSGTGVTGDIFDPAMAGPGVHTITYTFTDGNQCTNAITHSVTVYDLPAATASVSPGELCEGNSITFTGFATGGSNTGYTYQWSGPAGFSSALPSPVILSALPVNSGTYSLQVKDSHNCSLANTVSVTVQVNELPVAGIVSSPVNACLGSNISISGTATGGSGSGYQFTWSGPAGFTSGQQDITLNNAQLGNSGNYYLTVKDDKGCESFSPAVAVVTVYPLPQITASSASANYCSEDTIHMTSFSSGGNSTAYSFTWSGPGGFSSNVQNPVINNVQAVNSGLYFVTVTDANNCQGVISIPLNITVHPRPTVTATATPTEICAGNPVQFNGVALGGSGSGYIYDWHGPNGFTSGQASPSISSAMPVQSGQYTFNVTDGNNCKALNPAILNLLVHPLPVAQASVSSINVCEKDTIHLTGNGSGGTLAYTFNWTGPSGFVSILQNPLVLNAMPSQSGFYSLQVTDAHNCTSTLVYSNIVTVHSLPIAHASATQLTVCQGNTINLNGLGTGGSGSGYLFSWSGPQGYSSGSQSPVIANAQVNMSGYYRLRVTDANLCHSQPDSVLITVNPTPQPVAGSNSPVCAGYTLNLTCTPNGLASYQWNGPNSFTSNSQNPSVLNAQPVASGTYTVTVSNTLNCPNTASVTVVVNPLPVAFAGPDQTIPYGTFTTLSGSATGCSGNCTYTWQPSSMISTLNTIQNPVTVNLTATQVYYLVIFNSLTGCTSIADSVTIFVTGFALSTSPTATPAVICAGTSSQLDAHAIGGNLTYTYNWSPSSSLNNSAIANPVATPSATTTYYVTVNDGFNQVVSQISVDVVPAVILIVDTDTVLCEGNCLHIINVSCSNYSSFVWTSDGDGTFSAGNTLDPVYCPGPLDLSTGHVNLTISAYGIIPCGEVIDTVKVTISPATVAYAGPDDTICGNQSFTIGLANAQNANAVHWSASGTGTFDDSTLLHPVYTPGSADITAGFVTLSITAINPSGVCSDSTDSMLLTIKAIPPAEAGPDVSVCYGDTTNLLASGGVSYIWSPSVSLSSSTVPDPKAWPASTTLYKVTVSLNGCSAVDSVKVTVRPLPFLIIPQDTTLCPGDSVRLWVRGAHSYVWSTGSTDSVLWVKPPYSFYYLVTGTDQSGCSNVAQIGVFVYPAVNLVADPPEPVICSGDMIFISVTGTSFYHWYPETGLSSPHSGNVVASPTHTTNYIVTGTSNDGCTAKLAVNIIVSPRPVLILPDTEFVCQKDSIVLNAGWNDAVDYQWQDGSIFQFYTINEPGTYIVTATNQGCEVSDTCIVLACTRIWIPNAFTPDGNNLNDYFLAKSTLELEEFTMYIFNRWGEIVFTSHDIYSGWDGKYQGNYCTPGVFSWVIYYKSRDAGNQRMQGTLTLIR